MNIKVTLLLVAALLAGSVPTFAHPFKPVYVNAGNTENRNVSDFKGINLSGSYNYYITQGNATAVRVEAPSKLLPYIVTEVKNGVLNVYTKNHTNWSDIFNDEKIAVYITAKDINSIKLSGSGDVFFKEGITGTDMSITLSGSGDVTGKISATSIECTLTGSGDLRISGRVENATFKVVGSGDLTASELKATNANVSVVGSGDASVNASSSLKAKISGSGDIRYSGSPKNVLKTTSGSGDITRG